MADQVERVVVDAHGHVVALVDAAQDVGDLLLDGRRRDPLGGVEGLLLLAPAVGLVEGGLQRAGHGVGVENDPALDVARGPPDGLHQRGGRAQEALLVGVQDRDQGAFRDVQALAQQVDPDEHVEDAEAQVAHDLDALQGVDVGVQVAHPQAGLVQVLGQVLGHALGQRRGQHPEALGGGVPALGHQVVDLGFDRTHDADRVDQPGGADHLLDEDAAGLRQLPGPGGGRDADRLRPHGLPLLELERPVVDAGRQAEAVIGERRLALEVAAGHAVELGHGDVALVDEQDEVVGDVLEQRRRRLARRAAREIARVVLDPGAGPGRLDHLQVEGGALLDALGLERLAGLVEVRDLDLQVLLDLLDRLLEGRARRDVVAVGVDLDALQGAGLLAGQGVELVDRLDLVAEQRDPPGAVLQMGREDLHRVAAHPEGAAVEVGVVAPVVQLDQGLQQLVAPRGLAGFERDRHGGVGLRRAHAVDARHRGDDDHVLAFEQRARRRVAQAVDLLVDRAFLLDVGVRARHVGLGHVVVVVGDEILDRVVREEALHLGVELGGQGLVGRQDQRRALQALNDVGHGEGLARAGDPEQDLVAFAAHDALHQLVDGLGLVAGRRVVRLDA